jgi:hypothetical protein
VGREVGPDEAIKLLKLAREHLELMRNRVPDLSDLEPSSRTQNGPAQKKMGA